MLLEYLYTWRIRSFVYVRPSKTDWLSIVHWAFGHCCRRERKRWSVSQTEDNLSGVVFITAGISLSMLNVQYSVLHNNINLTETL